MLRALPKSQQARWLEIGRAFERVQRPARPGEHVSFTPVAEAGPTGKIPTRFSARTARIPSALRPASSDAAAPSAETMETSEAPSPPAVTEPTPPSVEPEVATATEETETWTGPETAPLPAEPVAVAATEAMPITDAGPIPALADFVHEELPVRRRPTPAGDWGGWSSYAMRKDFVPDEPMPAPPDTSPAAAPLAPEAPPVPSTPAEQRADNEPPRVSAIEFFRAAPW